MLMPFSLESPPRKQPGPAWHAGSPRNLFGRDFNIFGICFPRHYVSRLSYDIILFIEKNGLGKGKMVKLGVNIDHIAVLREARRINDPDPLQAIWVCRRAGADQITIHLREDRRHIRDEDAEAVIRHSPLPVNLECSVEEGIIDFICLHRPLRATIVPEKREEVTTEGGLAVTGGNERLAEAVRRLQEAGVEVSLFIDPDSESVRASAGLGADWIEFHTGRYANVYAMLYGNLARTPHAIKSLDLPRGELSRLLEEELETLSLRCEEALSYGLRIAAGHGLNYENVQPVAGIRGIEELNIGQSIIARSVFDGLGQAVREMKRLISEP
jgi:pyridoxine 5-phosphate synthase